MLESLTVSLKNSGDEDCNTKAWATLKGGALFLRWFSTFGKGLTASYWVDANNGKVKVKIKSSKTYDRFKTKKYLQCQRKVLILS